MYKLQPIFKSAVETPHPSCVYKMKKISDHFNDSTTENGEANSNLEKEIISNGEIEELEKRWTEITSRLEKLQSELNTIKCDTSFAAAEERQFQDLVIRANPSRPPYSLQLVQQRIEKLGMHVYARTHTHSAASEDKLLTDKLKNFLSSNSQLERSLANLAITLIWTKDGLEEPSLIVSPSSQAVAIRGEANIARYFARLLPGLTNYESDIVRAAQLDQFLDLTEPSAALGARGTKRDRAAALQSLEKTLSTRKSLDGGSELGLVDFVVYSALANSGAEKELGQNIRTWMDRCRSIVSAVN